MDSSLVIVGSGIKFFSHLTTEAKIYIEQSNKVLYLVNEPAMQDWIQHVNPQAESLDNYYTQHRLRFHCYRAITNYILETLRKKNHVCVVLYGHPAVFAKPGIDAVRQAKEEGHYAKILPGISAEDCLYADLLIDPGMGGCQLFDATDFLIHRRQFNCKSHLILWQVSVIGELGHAKTRDNIKGISLLVNYLKQYYDPSHQAILYEAAQYPGFEPRIVPLSINELPKAKFSPLSTLYIPPAQKASCDQVMLEALDMDRADLN